ncbi:hypothetical protein [Streptomyces sp. NBC_01205]|uniref:hypothetical protein n=1 Tax=Streptomyces sp. NBC_01205 TaxID=2903771 RepID=UPI002E14D50D|nr:hypothetical protein OG573_15965 [Streptomyces sp. NBC_01205]
MPLTGHPRAAEHDREGDGRSDHRDERQQVDAAARRQPPDGGLVQCQFWTKRILQVFRLLLNIPVRIGQCVGGDMTGALGDRKQTGYAGLSEGSDTSTIQVIVTVIVSRQEYPS